MKRLAILLSAFALAAGADAKTIYDAGLYSQIPLNRGVETYDAKDAWHHVALVVDRTAGANGTVACYYDRKPVYEEVLSTPPNFAASQLAVGGHVGDAAAFRFVGDIDDVRVTAAALAPGEMLQRRSAGLGMMLIVR